MKLKMKQLYNSIIHTLHSIKLHYQKNPRNIDTRNMKLNYTNIYKKNNQNNEKRRQKYLYIDTNNLKSIANRFFTKPINFKLILTTLPHLITTARKRVKYIGHLASKLDKKILDRLSLGKTEQQQLKGQNQQLRVELHQGLVQQRLRGLPDALVHNPRELLSRLNRLKLSELRPTLFRISNSLDNKTITLSPFCLAEPQAPTHWGQIKHELCLFLVMFLYKDKYIIYEAKQNTYSTKLFDTDRIVRGQDSEIQPPLHPRPRVIHHQHLEPQRHERRNEGHVQPLEEAPHHKQICFTLLVQIGIVTGNKMAATPPIRTTTKSKTPLTLRTATASRPTWSTSWKGSPSHESNHLINPFRLC